MFNTGSIFQNAIYQKRSYCKLTISPEKIFIFITNNIIWLISLDPYIMESYAKYIGKKRKKKKKTDISDFNDIN